MHFEVIAIIFFFVILISIQYSLNKVIVLLREIKEILKTIRIKE